MSKLHFKKKNKDLIPLIDFILASQPSMRTPSPSTICPWPNCPSLSCQMVELAALSIAGTALPWGPKKPGTSRPLFTKHRRCRATLGSERHEPQTGRNHVRSPRVHVAGIEQLESVARHRTLWGNHPAAMRHARPEDNRFTQGPACLSVRRQAHEAPQRNACKRE